MRAHRKFGSGATAFFREKIALNATEKDVVSEVVEQALIAHIKAK